MPSAETLPTTTTVAVWASARVGKAKRQARARKTARVRNARAGQHPARCCAPERARRREAVGLSLGNKPTARLGSARLGSARLGSARLGSARLGSARLGSARLGSARLGSEESSQHLRWMSSLLLSHSSLCLARGHADRRNRAPPHTRKNQRSSRCWCCLTRVPASTHAAPSRRAPAAPWFWPTNPRLMLQTRVRAARLPFGGG